MSHDALDPDLDALARVLVEMRARVAPLVLARHARRAGGTTAAERLSTPQHLALLALAHGPLTISALAAATGVAVSTATRMAQALGRAGWIAAAPGAPGDDRRRRPVELTAEGRAVMDEASAVTEERVRALLAALDGSERAAIVAGAAALLKAVQLDEERRARSEAASRAASTSSPPGAGSGSGVAPAGRMPSRMTER